MSLSDEPLLQCYNRACRKKYRESENNDQACVYHPDKPDFHDAYKIWSCCQKKTTDFTEFLGIKGCAIGPHSNKKPLELEKPKKSFDTCTDQQVTNKPVNKRHLSQRPSDTLPMVPLKRKVLSSLKTQLEKLSIKDETEKDMLENFDNSNVQIGTKCKNLGCRATYKDKSSNEEICYFHPGRPIFHEGMKYYACCQKKTSDFESFLAQVGCESGSHLWYVPITSESSENMSQSCRYDWHQTAEHVVLTVYSKLPLHEECIIEANAVKLKVFIVFSGNERKNFGREFVLYGTINVEESCVEFSASKVEISMKKEEAISWFRINN